MVLIKSKCECYYDAIVINSIIAYKLLNEILEDEKNMEKQVEKNDV